MTLTVFQRRAVLAGVLIATVAAAIAPVEDETPAAPPSKNAAARPARELAATAAGARSKAAAPLPELNLERLAPPAPREAVRDAFEERSWAPPPPKPAPPPPPAAPALPYRYLGKMMEDGAIVVFLAKQDRNYAVRAGDRLDGTYEIEAITPGVMTFNYLPLGQKQTMAIGAAN